MIETLAPEISKNETSESAEMLREMAHELRQPLSTIESIAYYLDLVLPPDSGRVRTQIERLKRMVEQSNWIVSNAVNFVQTAPTRPQLMGVRDLMGSAALECSYGSPIEYNLDESDPLVRIDPGQAVHLFYTLLVLFRTAVCSDPHLCVSCSSNGFETVIRLSTGRSGVPEMKLPNLSGTSGNGLPPGAGLSLASVRKILEAHNGQTEVAADGESLTVTLKFPL
jgi:signal transduction histidine kinase